MKASELIDKLHNYMDLYGDEEVMFADYDGDPKSAKMMPVGDVTFERNTSHEAIIIWDK